MPIMFQQVGVLRSTVALYIAGIFISVIHPADTSLATWMHIGLSASSQNGVFEANLRSKVGRNRGSASFRPNNSVNVGWCHTIPGLVDHQVALCKRVPRVFAQVTNAAKLAISECQNQFRQERWNCSTTNDSSVFGNMATKGNRETAFIAAISSAAVVHAVVRACSSGNLSDCSCDTRKDGQKDPSGGWKWSGCSDNIDYGMEFSRLFNDAPEDKRHKDARSIRDAMHLHNKAAGRTAVQKNMELNCRCHGVSGSCEMKTCWKITAKFGVVGTVLKQQYLNAVHIVKKSISKLKRRERSVRRKPIKSDELVFLEKSPDYCKINRKRGIFGTSGRTCSTNSSGSDSCGKLCCGRGFSTKVLRRSERCHCKFVWCCEVRCKTCQVEYKVHTCR